MDIYNPYVFKIQFDDYSSYLISDLINENFLDISINCLTKD